jgi:anti-sigma-K factor RskA
MTSQADFHLDMGAMALGALPDDELAQVQAHLETCESCTTELAGFRETVAMLGAVSAQTPPASLRRSIMARIAVTPQLPPLVTPAEPSPSPTEPAEPAVPVVPATAEGTPDATPTDLPDNVVPIRRWFRRPGALIAAAVAAVVIGGGAVVAINQTGGPGTQVAQTPEECIAQAADKELITPAAGNEGSVTYAASCSAVLLDVTGLPALPADKTYQLWALKGQEARSLEPLPAATAGEPELVTRSTLPGENAVAITVEPAGGSKQPTFPIVWQAVLT